MKPRIENYAQNLVLKPEEARNLQGLLQFSDSHFSLFDQNALDVPHKTVVNLTEIFQNLNSTRQEVEISGLQLISLYKLLGEIRRMNGPIETENFNLTEDEIENLDQKIECVFNSIPPVTVRPSIVTFKIGG